MCAFGGAADAAIKMITWANGMGRVYGEHCTRKHSIGIENKCMIILRKRLLTSNQRPARQKSEHELSSEIDIRRDVQSVNGGLSPSSG